MKRTIAVVLFTNLTGILCAQDKTIQTIKKYCYANHLVKQFNGNILIAKHGKIIFEKSYGYSDIQKKIPLTKYSVFNSASISKEFTAAAIMLLKEKGLLKLEDSLRKFFPDLPYNNINLRHMLTHTSGLVSTEFIFKEWKMEKEITSNDLLVLLNDKRPPLLFQPGTKFEYSNIAYVLLAMIVEKITLQSYPLFLKQNIFNKLGMNDTQVYTPGQKINAVIKNYIYDYISDSAVIKTYFPPTERADWKKGFFASSTYGNGNIYTTTGDLLKWQLGLNNFKIVNKSSYNEMTQPFRDADGLAGIQNYGYGFSINSVYSDTMLFHNGGTLGFSTTLRYLKKKDITIITLANTNRTNDPVEAIMAILYNDEIEFPILNKEMKLTEKELEFFVGTYEFAERKFEIQLKDGALFRVVPNAEPLKLIPKAKNRLYYSDESDRELIFKKNQDKLIVKLLKPDGLVITLNKLK